MNGVRASQTNDQKHRRRSHGIGIAAAFLVIIAVIGAPLVQSAPDSDPWPMESAGGGSFPLELLNAGAEVLTVGFTGYASLVVVQNGVVVAMPDPMPEPYTSPALKPGETTSVSNTAPEPCNSNELPAGDYEIYASIDARVSTGDVTNGSDVAAGTDDETEEMLVFGGPWHVRLG